ncbi:holin family protein [Ureibacillus sp. 179-F W5.1 NHS]|uniref:Holin n=1 Tax=Lysinibacillus halotolerans TaxID=1368476 RepID=A0A3M8H4K5_9BACI|nr:phage holin family protein [Lysinibacillus halotolerans]RNC97356.1 holin [Lysinibacillus halotolerans]
MKEFSFNSIVSLFGTFVTYWLGGWDQALKFLVAFMVIDYVTGVLVGIKKKKLNSEIMFWGGIRKAVILIVIAIAVMLDTLVGNEQPLIRTLAIMYYVGREGLSTIENIGALGVKIPSFVSEPVSKLSKIDEDEKEIEKKEKSKKN